MYIDEIFQGLDNKNYPNIKCFEDVTSNDLRTIFIKDITVNSFCEHHLLPMIGKAYISYIPNKKIIGLSKINRIVDFFSKKPQLQERLTCQIAEDISKVLNTENVAVYTVLDHLCVKIRGIKDYPSKTAVSCFKGAFKNRSDLRSEFLSQIL